MAGHPVSLAAPVRREEGEVTEEAPATRVVTARSAKRAAAVFHVGNMLAVAVPVPLGILWLGASMLFYALNRHHPNPEVGHSIQRGAYVFYGVAGFVTAAAIFIPGGGLVWWLAAWALAALVIVPFSVRELWRLRRARWSDLTLGPAEQEAGA